MLIFLARVRDSGANSTSGYFLNGTGYENVAVLAVSGFAPQGTVDSIEYLTNFQSTVGSFLAQSKAAGKTRLVIDLQANGGGFVIAGYELFAQVRNFRFFSLSSFWFARFVESWADETY